MVAEESFTMRKRARSRFEIYADIIMTLHRWGRFTRPSRLAMAVGVPYDRLMRYMEELRKLNLVTRDNVGIVLTDDGAKLAHANLGSRNSLVAAIYSIMNPKDE
jgi:DtxR family manganese transport transcriptional regulator